MFQGDIENKWEEVFGNNVDVVGWEGTTTTETKSFKGYVGKANIYSKRVYEKNIMG